VSQYHIARKLYRMALKKCKECGREVSSKADKCPNCGAPVKKDASLGAGCLTIIIVVGLIVWWGSKGDSTNSPTAPPAAANTAPDKITAWTMAEEFVKKNLKSPSTADFGSVFGDYQDPNNGTQDLGGGRFYCHGWVDAENSFGAKLRTNWECTIKFVGNDNWAAESVKIEPVDGQ
jgi:hypothetical protein